MKRSAFLSIPLALCSVSLVASDINEMDPNQVWGEERILEFLEEFPARTGSNLFGELEVESILERFNSDDPNRLYIPPELFDNEGDGWIIGEFSIEEALLFALLNGEQESDDNTAELVNLSVRGYAATGDEALIAGFITEHDGFAHPTVVTDQFLMRGIGPALSEMGVEGAAPNPSISYFIDRQLALFNDDWELFESLASMESAIESTGAFELIENGGDSAIVSFLEVEGTNSIHVTDEIGGIALAEIYATPESFFDLVNLSCRGQVKAAEGGGLIGGFTIEGEGELQLLIRAAGPALESFGVPGTLPDPVIAIYSSADAIGSNAAWESTPAMLAAVESTGAFAFEEGSNDAAVLARLPEGSYTVHVSSDSGQEGIALLELYVID